MAGPTTLLKRSLIFIHRWLGVALSLIFLLWFVSGIVMMYWSFPAVSAQDRLRRAVVLDPAQIKISADEANAVLGGDQLPEQVRLTSFDGRPVYRFVPGGGRSGGESAMVYADDGTRQQDVDGEMVDRAAAAWAGRPIGEANKASVEEVDQWTVGGGLRMRPLYKYSWPDGQQVYVNGTTAEVVQYTTTASRFWAYLGAIPHWVYFTPLRKHPPEWFSFVVWSSLIGTVSTLIGAVIALWMYSPRKRYRHAHVPTSIPYRGWKRWHTILGLSFGVVTTTWAFSGLLSMGPFPLSDLLTDLTVPADVPRESESGDRGEDLAAALRGEAGLQVSAYVDRHPRAAIDLLPDFDVRELEYTSFAGAPVYIASNGEGDTRIVPVRGDPRVRFESDDILQVVRRAAASHLAELRVMEEYDAYYLDRRGELPLPVVYARMNDAAGSRYYIDPKTARVVRTYSARDWVSRWLYHGLHSLDFPWLYKHRPLWDIVVLTLMLGGTAVCVTSIVLTWRVLGRKLSAVLRARFNIPNEDLALESDG